MVIDGTDLQQLARSDLQVWSKLGCLPSQSGQRNKISVEPGYKIRLTNLCVEKLHF